MYSVPLYCGIIVIIVWFLRRIILNHNKYEERKREQNQAKEKKAREEFLLWRGCSLYRMLEVKDISALVLDLRLGFPPKEWSGIYINGQSLDTFINEALIKDRVRHRLWVDDTSRLYEMTLLLKKLYNIDVHIVTLFCYFLNKNKFY